MTNNMIYAHDFNNAIEMLTTIRDKALAMEADIRAGDPIADFDDAMTVLIDIDPIADTPAFAAMMNFIRSID